ncbi:HU family DNA-binding protein [Segatella bryantii]|uniref:HU family DNA-binding protein n=1 Tax=Segatella bryantii TaxID=77095 RepID=UPI001EDB517E|nr:HU family DNA-binding protein [Segatella bryantii]UKK73574.1 HU family DNA-binding protein [Segatella bryantii]
MSKIGVNELAKVLVNTHKLSVDDAEQFVRLMFDTVNEGLQEDKQVKIKGFGTFKVLSVKDRESVDVNTGERIIIEGRDKISFTPDAIVKDIVNKPFAQFETVELNDGVDFDAIDEKYSDSETDHQKIGDGGILAFRKEKRVVKPVTKVMEIEPEVGDENTESTEQSAVSIANSDGEGILAFRQQLHTQNERETGTQAYEDHKFSGIEVALIDSQEKENFEQKKDLAEEPSMSYSASATDDQSVMLSESDEITVDSSHIEQNQKDTVPVESLEVNSEDENVLEISSDKLNVKVDIPKHSDKKEEEQDQQLLATDMDDNDEDESIRMPKRKLILWVCSVFLLLGSACFFAYQYGKSIALQNIQHITQASAKKTVAKPNTIDAASTAVLQKAKEDSVRMQQTAEAVALAEKATQKELQKEVAKHEDKKDSISKKRVSQSVDSRKATPQTTTKYDSDPRIRTGAYAIVGVEKTVTVRRGQTLSSISRSNLGPGMECYVEALNGAGSIKEGQVLKIPKLVLKKRLK